MNKNFENANLTKAAINEKLTSMSRNSRIANKLTNAKNSYFVINNESIQRKEDIDDSNSNRRKSSNKKTNEIPGKNKLSVTVILGGFNPKRCERLEII